MVQIVFYGFGNFGFHDSCLPAARSLLRLAAGTCKNITTRHFSEVDISISFPLVCLSIHFMSSYTFLCLSRSISLLHLIMKPLLQNMFNALQPLMQPFRLDSLLAPVGATLVPLTTCASGKCSETDSFILGVNLGSWDITHVKVNQSTPLVRICLNPGAEAFHIGKM